MDAKKVMDALCGCYDCVINWVTLDIKWLVSFFYQVRFTFVPRSKNGGVHMLAKQNYYCSNHDSLVRPGISTSLWIAGTWLELHKTWTSRTFAPQATGYICRKRTLKCNTILAHGDIQHFGPLAHWKSYIRGLWRKSLSYVWMFLTTTSVYFMWYC